MAPMLNKEMAEINWEEKNAIEIKNLVRGLNPIMGAYTYINGKRESNIPRYLLALHHLINGYQW